MKQNSSFALTKVVSASFTQLRIGAALLGAALLFAGPSVSAQSPAPSKKPSASSTTTKKKTSARRSRARGQQAPTADRIREIQEALAREGHLKGEPTGKWDAATIAALKSFQGAQALNASGKLDARTLQRLGLGSEVAGRAAPRPAEGATEPQRQ